MAEQTRKEIILSINTDASQAGAGIQEVKQQLNDLNNVDTSKSVKTLKQELRDANNEAQKIGQTFGTNSKEFVEAAKKVAHLKDGVEEYNKTVNAFNPGNKLAALVSVASAAVRGVQGVASAMTLLGVESEDTAKTIAKLQALMGLADSLEAIGDFQEGFANLKKVAVDAFKGIKTAIGSTGIGLLVIALGAIYAYWDDIKAAVSGVSAEQKKLNKLADEHLVKEQKKLDEMGSQDNVLKLQGKSEKEILQMKVKQIQAVIDATVKTIEQDKITTKAQVAAADRNQKFLKGFLDFITLPIKYLYEGGAKAINSLIGLVNKIPGVDIDFKVNGQAFDQGTNAVASFFFDPVKEQKAADAALAVSDKALGDLKNQKAGYQLASNAIDKEASDKRTADAKALAEKRKEELAELAELEKESVHNIRQSKLSEREKELDDLSIEFEAKKKKYRKYGKDITAITEEYNINRKAVELKYAKAISDAVDEVTLNDYDKRRKTINDKYDALLANAKTFADQLTIEGLRAEENANVDTEQTNTKNTINAETNLINTKVENGVDENDTPEARIEKLQAVFDAEKIFKETKFQEELAKLGTDQDAIRNLKAKHQQETTADEKAFAAERVKAAAEEAAQKIASMSAIGNATGSLADLTEAIFNKQTVAGKALGIATATINMYQGASEVIKAKTTIPEPFGTIQKIASVAAILAMGIKQIRGISAVKVPGGGGAGASAPNIGTAPVINASATSAPATVTGDVRVTNPQNGPIAAYITDRELTNNEQRSAFLNRLGTI